MLDTDLLEQFESRLRALGVPAIDAAQPGLSVDAMDTLVAPLGITLPLEARVWWGWRDGVPWAAGAAPMEIAPGGKWLPLAAAVEECLRIRRMIADAWADGPLPIEDVWSSNWLPLVHSECVYVIDTNVQESGPCPVRAYWFDEPEAPPDLSSMGELVSLWIEAIDRKTWSYDRGEDHWVVDHEQRNSWWAARRGIV